METRSETAVSLFIVEDDAHFRETFIDAMWLRGVDVQGAGAGFEGLRALQDLPPASRPNLIILDVKLPDLHGFELCKRIKRIEAYKDTPVLFVSASAQYNDPRDRVEGLLAGAVGFLPKPISVEKLWTEISHILS